MTTLHFKKLPHNIPFNSQINIETYTVTPATHGFHKYPGKFIPQIPEWAIETFLTDQSQVILDPFVGSGTTLVEGIMHGHNSYGIDIDPLSCLISKVKSTPLDVKQFSLIGDWLLINKESAKPEFKPTVNNLNHWFSDDAIEKLSKLRTLIDQIPVKFGFLENVQDFYDAFIIVLSSIIRRVSNADNQSQKTYVSGTKPKKPAEVYSLFTKQISLYIKGYTDFKNTQKNVAISTIYHSSGNPDFSMLLPEKVDLIVTSPPYIKSIDYVYNQMVELFWIGDLFSMNTQAKQNEKRKKYIGTTLVPKKAYVNFPNGMQNLGINLLDQTINDILNDKKNGQKHAYIVHKYFSFMDKHFYSASKSMKKGAYYVMAVGNSTVSNVSVDTASILVQLAQRYNLELENKWSYIIKNHFMGFDRKNRGGKINIDNMLIFKKES